MRFQDACLMDKYLWEGVQLVLDRCGTSKFHATCEWSELGWTVVLSLLVHLLRRVGFDDRLCLLTVAQPEPSKR